MRWRDKRRFHVLKQSATVQEKVESSNCLIAFRRDAGGCLAAADRQML